jgi:hypothetical protein
LAESYCEKGYIIKSNLQINALLIKIPIRFSTEIEIIDLKVYMEAQKTWNSQSNPKQKRAMLEVS